MEIHDTEVLSFIKGEEKRQQEGIELIASENYQSHSVLSVQASVFANKYAEGFPGKRYYGGQERTDKLESLAIQRAMRIFQADHANVQALSGAAANLCVYAATMEPGDTILGLEMGHGGHLTHGSPASYLSKVFNFVPYGTKKSGEIDYDQIHSLAGQYHPKVILTGFSAYPREIDYLEISEIANKYNAVAYADISHIGGFIAAGLLKNPLNEGFHAMMTTTHKSLRGPRGAIILSKGIVGNPLKKVEATIGNIPTRIDRAVFPGIQGGPHMDTIAGIAVALKEVENDAFKDYAKQALLNAQVMAEDFLSLGYSLVTGGTDNHMIILDFSNNTLDGSIIESVLDKVGISVSKSLIPYDTRPPFRPSGVRIGTPAMTTRGVKEKDIKQIVHFIDEAIKNYDNDSYLQTLHQEVKDFSSQFPLP